MLEPGEITYLRWLCENYAVAVRDEINKEWRAKGHTPLKVHIIEKHLPEFAETHGSVGLFAEDACESIHALCNKLSRRYACIRGDVDRDKAMINGLRLLQSKRVAKDSAETAKSRKRKNRAAADDGSEPEPVNPRTPAVRGGAAAAAAAAAGSAGSAADAP